ncbi:unnamed protein product [Staurois parvus]|uniref:Ribosomal protein S3 n=1 Tax=Staurois parvus TaxID=386267 RepID=A0ABN9BPH8_9NEOB|nr:unnamed protein product [Staurois parvus]
MRRFFIGKTIGRFAHHCWENRPIVKIVYEFLQHAR